MSHIVSIKTKITDRKALEALCKELNFPFAVQPTFKGWAGREHPCEFRITVPGQSWDIGVVRAADYTDAKPSWELQCDHFLFRDARVGQDCQRVVQLYGVHKATLEAQRRGMMVTREQQANGTIRLQIQGRAM